MKKKILIVDDRTEFRTLTKTILSRDYEVETAENGIDALAKLHQGYLPDLIITDLMMPELGGRDFVEQLKASGMHSNIPVIVLSSIDKSDEKIKLLNLGAEDYLEKPYNPNELLVRIGKILRNK
jgi:two-component system, chemotaxis family, chemotaxis protein CheY